LRVNAGFSLLEVMVSMFVASVALIGLGVTQLKSLQFANNSFDYTVSLVQGQNTIERLWPHLCDLQRNNPGIYDEAAFQDALKPPQTLRFRYSLDLPENYSDEMLITVKWQDLRVPEDQQNQILNQITLNASFVEVPVGCGF